MIKSLEVINYLGDNLVLELRAPEKTGLYIKTITGIGPGKATINTTDLASSDGGIYNSARLELRNIVLTIGFLEGPIDGVYKTIEDLRQKTYAYFPRKRFVRLIFHTDNRDLYADGYVESNEPEIFSQEETTQISIICPDPNVYNAVGSSVVDFSSVNSSFEFPFENNSLIDNEIEFGSIEPQTNKILRYEGEVETGFTLFLHPSQTLTGFSFFNYQTGETIAIDSSKVPNGIVAGDSIEICTVRGQKYAELTRAGLTYNIINALKGDGDNKRPDWIQLYKGDNIFAYTATAGLNNLSVLIYYRIAYEGV